MKQRTKRFLNTIYLSVIVGVMTGCLGGGGSGDPVPSSENPTTNVGTLTVANAPTSVGGNFVAVEQVKAKISSNMLLIYWGEESVNHVELILLTFNLTNSQIVLQFSSTDPGSSSGSWRCSDGSSSPTDACKGITVDKTTGVVTFASQELSGQVSIPGSSSASVITLNGTLHFTPPAGITPTPTPGPTPGTGTSTPRGNNGALISGGAVIGSGTTAVGNLRKQIAATVLVTNPSFSIGTAYATRSTTSLDYAEIILSVTNIGNQTLCFVKLAGVTYRDASGTAIGVPGIDYVNGSVRKLSPMIFTNTCLVPGETGMVGDIKANLYTKVATMEFTLESSASASNLPAASVIPQSYTMNSTDASVSTINVKNVGTGPAQIGGIHTSMVFLLDDAEQPLTWTYASDPSVVVPASSTTAIPGDVYYDGSGSKLLVFVDFEDAAATALKQTFGIALPAFESCSATLSADELKLCMNEIRNQRLESLKSTYDTQLSTP